MSKELPSEKVTVCRRAESTNSAKLNPQAVREKLGGIWLVEGYAQTGVKSLFGFICSERPSAFQHQ